MTALSLLSALASCSSGHATGSSANELPSDCRAFVAKFEACLAFDLPASPEIAQQRATQTQAALETRAHAPGADLANLAAGCHDNLQRLSQTCGNKH